MKPPPPHPKQKTAILILGLGVSGRAAADLALNKGYQVEIRDTGDDSRLDMIADRLRNRGAIVYLGENALQTPFSATPELAVSSPGIAPDSHLGKKAAEAGCAVIDEFDFGFRYCDIPILGVTGSNGKTTTVKMTAHCLPRGGIKAMTGGNIGRPLCEIVQLPEPPRIIVAELSSFQLERCSHLRTVGAALLNFSGDHLDRHGDLRTYLQAKLKIFDTIDDGGRAIIRKDLLEQPEVNEKIRSLPGRPTTFCSETSSSKPQSDFFLSHDGFLCRTNDQSIDRIIRAKELPFPGRHNLENAMAALALCELAGLEPAVAAEALSTFQMEPHRMQNLPAPEGIRIINDSKSTNPDALCRALQSLFDEGEKSIILIAGGLNKQMDFSSVKPWLRKAVKKVICTGSCASYLASSWGDEADCVMKKNFTEAVTAALASANFGDTVLLSPGCASQDAFSDYAERGQKFIELISEEQK